MPLISNSIPNLINGVSQQPASLRLPSQAEAVVNAYPSIVDGLVKRPPSRFLKKLLSSTVGNTLVHFINRDPTERYIVTLYDDNVKVFDVDGTEKTVATPDGVLYLNSADPRSDFRAITIADYTYIVNKSITVAMDSTLSAVNDSSALIFIKAGGYGQKYSVNIDGVQKATHTTSTTAVDQITTDYIAAQLESQLVTNLGAGWTVTRANHVIKIVKDNDDDFTATIDDSLGGTSLKAINESVQKFTDLPTVSPNDHIVKIAGDNLSSFDDYYVQFTADDGTFSEGTWSECVAPGIEYMLDATTMPHVLVRESGGTFTFREAVWDNREAGDEESAASPSCVDTNINDIFFFRNRLGMLADQSVILSAAGSFFQFFPDTVTQVLDDQPIDVSASHTKVSTLRHAIPFNKQLILFSDQTQFVMDGTDLLTPKTANITTSTEFECDTTAKPVGAGNNVYFATTRGSFTGIREYFVDAEAQTMDAADVTAHVPQYVPSDVFQLAISTNEDILACVSSQTGEQNSLYFYKYYWMKQEKLQSAWFKWDFDPDVCILGVGFINSDLYMISEHDGEGVFLEAISLESGKTDDNTDYVTHLDQRITEDECSSVVYSAGSHTTTYTLPYDILGTMQVVSRANGSNVPGLLGDTVAAVPGTNTIEIVGDTSAEDVWIGRQYNLNYTFSEPVIKQEAKGGGQVAVMSAHIMLRTWSISYDSTGYFKVTVTPSYRDPYVYEFTGRILGSGNNVLGEVAIENGVFRVPVQSKSDTVDIVISSDSFLPCQLQSVEWEALYTIRSQRV